MEPGTASPPTRPGRDWLAAAVLAAATGAVFYPALNCGFVNYDDPQYVTQNPLVAGGLSGSAAGQAFTTFASGNWHPLTWLSLQLDATLWHASDGRPDPRGFHLTNVLLHSASAAVLFLALRSLTGCFWRSAAVALLFAVHPLRAESVAWVSERKDVLSVFFGLLALWAYAGYARAPSPRRYLLVAVPFALSLSAKPMLVTFPFLLLVLDWWPLGRLSALTPSPVAWEGGGGGDGNQLPDTRTPHPSPPPQGGRGQEGRRTTAPSPLVGEGGGGGDESLKPPPTLALPHKGGGNRTGPMAACIREKLPLFALAAVSCVVTVHAQARGGAVMGLQSFPLAERTGNAAVSYVTYLVQTVWPVGLAAYYPHPGGALPAWQAGGAILLLAALTAGAVVLRRRAPYLLAGWLWYLGTLVPVIGLVQVGGQAYADRYTYLPQAGLLTAACWAAFELAGARPALAAAGAAALALAVLTHRQLGVWTDSYALWDQARRVTRPNAVCLVNYGEALEEKGRSEEAAEYYREAIEREPDSALALTNLGVFLDRHGRHEEALRFLEKACRVSPAYALAHHNLGNALYRQGRLDEAAREIGECVRLEPDSVLALSNLGQIESGRGRFDRAADCYRNALRLQPDAPALHSGLGAALVRLGRREEGVAELVEAVRRDPRLAEAHTELGKALAAAGDADGAARQFDEAAKLNPRQAAAWYFLGMARGQQGRVADAAECLTRAVELDPASARFRSALAGAVQALSAAGRHDQVGQIAGRLKRLEGGSSGTKGAQGGP